MSMAFVMLEKRRFGVMGRERVAKSPEELVLEQNRRHKGDWLNYEVAAYYCCASLSLT